MNKHTVSDLTRLAHIFKASAVLPIDVLPAITVNSDLYIPLEISSKSKKPVEKASNSSLC